MDIETLLNLFQTRRSIRRFKPDPIPDDYVEKMLEAARWSPSGANAQPWEFIVVKDTGTKKRMVELYRDSRYEEYAIEQTRTEEMRHNQLRTPPELMGFGEAPVIIVVCGDRRTFQATVLAGRFLGSGGSFDDTYQKNLGNAVYGIHLAAAAMGIGAQWLTVLSEYEETLKPLLNVPPVITIHTLVPVGYPAYDPQPPYRRELDEIVHREKYDMSKYRSGEQVIEFIKHLRKKTRIAYSQEKTS